MPDSKLFTAVARDVGKGQTSVEKFLKALPDNYKKKLRSNCQVLAPTCSWEYYSYHFFEVWAVTKTHVTIGEDKETTWDIPWERLRVEDAATVIKHL